MNAVPLALQVNCSRDGPWLYSDHDKQWQSQGKTSHAMLSRLRKENQLTAVEQWLESFHLLTVQLCLGCAQFRCFHNMVLHDLRVIVSVICGHDLFKILLVFYSDCIDIGWYCSFCTLRYTSGKIIVSKSCKLNPKTKAAHLTVHQWFLPGPFGSPVILTHGLGAKHWIF